MYIDMRLKHFKMAIYHTHVAINQQTISLQSVYTCCIKDGGEVTPVYLQDLYSLFWETGGTRVEVLGLWLLEDPETPLGALVDLEAVEDGLLVVLKAVRENKEC